MYTLIAQNKYGQQLELTHNAAYDITDIDGIDPPDAVINTTRNANADGSVYNSSYIDNRTITITLSINAPAERNRINLYKYFKTKFPVRLYYQNATRNVYIDGYVQNIQVAYFNQKQTAQITVFCPQPLFNGVDESLQEFSNVESLFEFPFVINESKNLLNIKAKTTTLNGIKFTMNSDGTVTANGTATANANLILGSVSIASNHTYNLSGCPTGGGGSTYRLYWQGVSGNYDDGSGSEFTPAATQDINIRIVVYNGATVNNLVFKPMVTLNGASNVPTTYEEMAAFTYGTLSNYKYSDFATTFNTTFEAYYEPGIEFSRIEPNTEQSIINGGDVDTGVIISIHAIGPVTTPKIYNVDTGENIILNLTMADGDDILINTIKGQKNITLTSDGVTTNIIGNLADGSTWFQLTPGDNLFTVTADATPENMQVSFTITDQFEGV